MSVRFRSSISCLFVLVVVYLVSGSTPNSRGPYVYLVSGKKRLVVAGNHLSLVIKWEDVNG